MSHQQAPMATRRPTSRTRFGVSWTDDYAWLRDPAYPEVVDPEIRSYLEAENAWFERFMAPLRPQIASLHEELKARIKADDSSVPVREGDSSTIGNSLSARSIGPGFAAGWMAANRS